MKSKDFFSIINWVDPKVKLPEYNEEYLVLWDLEDGQNPVVTSMDFDVDKKMFSDPRGISHPQYFHEILLYADMPECPIKDFKADLDQPLCTSLDDYERTAVYGQCIHGENMANCSECNEIMK